MPISFIGQASAAAESVTLPAHVAGDLILIFAYRAASSVTPTIPAGFATVNTSAANINGHALAWKIAASSSEISGTWTNAQGIVAHVYRGASGVGGQAQATNAADPAAFPAVTMTATDGSSWVVGFIGTRISSSTVTNSPTGMVNRANGNFTGGSYGSDDTDGGVSSWTGANMTLTPSGSRYRIAVVEIVAEASGGATVTPNNASHSQAATEPTATPKSTISVNDAGHGHVASSPSLSSRSTILPDSATHGHGSTSPDLTVIGAISVHSASHGHAATSATITARYTIAPNDSAHQHTATSPTVSEGGISTPVAWLTFSTAPKSLNFEVKAKALTFVAKGSGMTEIITTRPKTPDEVWTITLELQPWITASLSASGFSAARAAGGVTVTSFEQVDADTGRFTITGGSPKEIAKIHAYANLSNGDRFAQVFHIPVI